MRDCQRPSLIGPAGRFRSERGRCAWCAYARLERAFREQIWPRHRKLIEQTRTVLTEKLLPKQAACFEYVLDRLGMQDPRLTIPVYLVAEGPTPGAFTHRRRGGGGVCFVSADSGSAALWPEIVLHESIHALDLATADQDTALQCVRKGLREAKIDPKDPLARDVPHTLMFVQAGETASSTRACSTTATRRAITQRCRQRRRRCARRGRSTWTASSRARRPWRGSSRRRAPPRRPTNRVCTANPVRPTDPGRG